MRFSPPPAPPCEIRYSSLSVSRRRLLSLIGDIRFGSIENLIVTDGDPGWEPPPTVTRVILLRDAASPRVQRPTRDFVLKMQMVQLLQLLEEIGTGTIQRIDVQDGLPFRILVCHRVPADTGGKR